MGEIVGNIDGAQVVLYAFWAFFAGLIWYLQAESRREGYPLENEAGEYNRDPWLQLPSPKTFRLPHGMGTRTYPNPENRDTRPIAAKPSSRTPGSPLVPTGNPLVDGVGPAAWAERPDHPDLTPHGTAKIQPLRVATDFWIAKEDPDPRGMDLISADGKVVAQIKDAWVDQTESVIRFYELDMGRKKNILIPMHFTVLRKKNGGPDAAYELYAHALLAEQYDDVPKTKSLDEITMLEEEKIMAYYGGGNLYATPQRSEPLI